MKKEELKNSSDLKTNEESNMLDSSSFDTNKFESKENSFVLKTDSNDNINVDYTCGCKIDSLYGEKISDDSFVLIQQDKKLHDQNFTTKPTTFFKDALKRFSKNKSSVVASIIIGVLVFFAIFIPIILSGDQATDMFDTTHVKSYEQHLPMKLFEPVKGKATGFWDGTKRYKNYDLPYELDKDGNVDYSKYVGDFKDESVIMNVTNFRKGYVDHATKNGSGGYAKIEAGASSNIANSPYMYHYAIKFTNLTSNNYKLNLTLGTRKQDGYLEYPSWQIIMKAKVNGEDTIFPVCEYSTEYGKEVKKESSDMKITPHETLEFNLSDLVKNSSIDPSIYNNQNVSFGVRTKVDPNSSVALYTKSFVITCPSLTGQKKAELTNISFGTKDCTIKDANKLVQQDVTIDGQQNKNYWASVKEGRFESVDTLDLKCDILVDRYLETYGWSKDKTVSETTMRNWINKGYVEYDFSLGQTLAPSSFKITEKGKKSGEVYVSSVEKQTGVEGKYAFSCTVLMYKWLGYKSMPIHIFGTNKDGKDLLKIMCAGLRNSLILGVIVTAINLIVGVIWGSISGFFGGTTDIVMERITDVLSGIPLIILMTVFTLLWGTNFFIFGLSLCITGWIGTASTTRSQFYRYRDREYVLASRTLGARSPRLIFRHILPNAIGTIITSVVLMIPSVIFSEASLSYLGLGLKGLDSFGVILSDNQAFLSTYPSELLLPSIVISLIEISFNLFGNGLRDAFNPQLKGTD